MKQHDVIISGLNMDLTDSIKHMVQTKIEKLYEHEEKIVRARIELEFDPHHKSHEKEYIAKGHLEIRGNDPICSAATDDLYKSIDLMVHKLDRMLRRRSRLNRTKRKTPHLIDIPAQIPKAV